MKKIILTYILIKTPVFYQLDYRQRFETKVSIPGLAGVAVKKSFETRYRPSKGVESIPKIQKTQLRIPENKYSYTNE